MSFLVSVPLERKTRGSALDEVMWNGFSGKVASPLIFKEYEESNGEESNEETFKAVGITCAKALVQGRVWSD